MRSLDAYTFKARVVPVIVVVLPPLLLLGTGVVLGARVGIATGLITTVLAAVAGQLGRDRGRGLQPELWNEWGGGPALQRLRFRGGGRPERVQRLHRHMENVLGDSLPDEAAEQQDPVNADEHYQDAVERLIGRTRDKTRFELLFAENVNYGQRRNLLGLRPIGITVATGSLVLAGVLMLTTDGSFADRATRYGPGGLAAVLVLLFWLLVVTRSWVRVPAEAYADRLVEAADALSADKQDQDPSP